MKNLKLIVVLVVLFIIALSGMSRAQDNQANDKKKTYKNTPAEQAKIVTDKMKTKLDLTDDQYSKILKIQTDRITYFRELRDKDVISKSEIKQKRDEFNNSIKNTLTVDQMKTYEKMKSEMKSKKKDKTEK